MKLFEQSAWNLRQDLLTGSLTARAICESVIDAVQSEEPQVHAYITLRDHEDILRDADRIDRTLASGEPAGPLAGIPISIKDNICTAALRTTCGSRMLENFVPPYDATVVKRLISAGAVIIGKTNMDEFAMGCSTENSSFGPTRNPVALDRVPGGTSGGAAASIASGGAVLAVASDTGGSIRQPASFCGVVGMKPTYGRVSRYGLIAYASSFDQIGALARDVRGASMLLAVVSGHDPSDSTSLRLPPVREVDELPRPLRVGIPGSYLTQDLEDDVASITVRAASILEKRGHTLVDVDLPRTDEALASYYIIACAEATSNLARYDGVRFGYRADAETLKEMYCRTRSSGFGDEARKRILLGTYVLSTGYYGKYYDKACRVRTLVQQDFVNAYQICDVILHPAAPSSAFRFGQSRSDPLAQYLGDAYSVIANLVGMPAISVPCGHTRDGLPVGAHLSADLGQDELLLGAALDLELGFQAEP